MRMNLVLQQWSLDAHTGEYCWMDAVNPLVDGKDPHEQGQLNANDTGCRTALWAFSGTERQPLTHLLGMYKPKAADIDWATGDPVPHPETVTPSSEMREGGEVKTDVRPIGEGFEGTFKAPEDPEDITLVEDSGPVEIDPRERFHAADPGRLASQAELEENPPTEAEIRQSIQECIDYGVSFEIDLDDVRGGENGVLVWTWPDGDEVATERTKLARETLTASWRLDGDLELAWANCVNTRAEPTLDELDLGDAGD